MTLKEMCSKDIESNTNFTLYFMEISTFQNSSNINLAKHTFNLRKGLSKNIFNSV